MQVPKAQTDVDSPPPLHLVEPPAKHRRTLPSGVAYRLTASVIGLGLFASLTPTPLYGARRPTRPAARC
jgi:hypothetical protein